MESSYMNNCKLQHKFACLEVARVHRHANNLYFASLAARANLAVAVRCAQGRQRQGHRADREHRWWRGRRWLLRAAGSRLRTAISTGRKGAAERPLFCLCLSSPQQIATVSTLRPEISSSRTSCAAPDPSECPTSGQKNTHFWNAFSIWRQSQSLCYCCE